MRYKMSVALVGSTSANRENQQNIFPFWIQTITYWILIYCLENCRKKQYHTRNHAVFPYRSYTYGLITAVLMFHISPSRSYDIAEI